MLLEQGEVRPMTTIWFQMLRKIRRDLTERKVPEEEQTEIIQRLKTVSLKNINLRGNMLNLKEKHIATVQGYYQEILKEYVTQV